MKRNIVKYKLRYKQRFTYNPLTIVLSEYDAHIFKQIQKFVFLEANKKELIFPAPVLGTSTISALFISGLNNRLISLFKIIFGTLLLFLCKSSIIYATESSTYKSQKPASQATFVKASNNEARDFGLEGKLQDKPQDKPKKKAVLGPPKFMAQQYLNDPNTPKSGLLWMQMQDIVNNTANSTNSGALLDYIADSPSSSERNYAFNLYMQIKNEPGFVPDPEKEIEVYKKLIKAEPDNFEYYKGILKIARGPPNSTYEEWAAYAKKAAELAPQTEKVHFLKDYVDALVNVYAQSDRSNKHIEDMLNAINKITTISPQDLEWVNIMTAYVKELPNKYPVRTK